MLAVAFCVVTFALSFPPLIGTTHLIIFIVAALSNSAIKQENALADYDVKQMPL